MSRLRAPGGTRGRAHTGAHTGEVRDADDWEPPPGADTPPAGPAGPRLLGLLGLAMGAVLAVNLLTGGGTGTPTRTTAPSPAPSASRTAYHQHPVTRPLPLGVDSIRRCPVVLGGVELGGDPKPRGAPLERWRCQPAADDRQAVVVRRQDGSFARNSAVVAWPVTAQESTPTGLEPSHDGRRRTLVWELMGSPARIRGDLPEAQLIRIAEAVRVMQGVLLVLTPEGFRTVHGGPYAPELVHEVRYNPAATGASPALGYDGLVFSGMQGGAELEDQVLAGGTPGEAGTIGGRPAVFAASVASGAVVWEPSPGLVAYVGYSGAAQSQSARDALLSLARQARVLTPAQFTALSR